MKKEEIQEVKVIPLKLKKLKLVIEGKTLLMDKFPDEAKKAILEKQRGKSKSGKKLRDIDKESKEAVHRLPNGKVGFPSQGFMAGMIESTSFVGDIKFSKKLVRGLKIINTVNGLIEIKFKKQDILEHSIGCNTKYTPQFHDWECELIIEFDENNISVQDILTLLNYAGFYYGIGIWSPRCKSGGNFGMYKIKSGGKDE